MDAIFVSRWNEEEGGDATEFFLPVHVRVFRKFEMFFETYKPVVVAQTWVILFTLFVHWVDNGFSTAQNSWFGAVSPAFFRDNFYIDASVAALATGVLSFLLVIRINLSYTRWWESRKSLEDIGEKLYEFCVITACWDQFTVCSALDRYVLQSHLVSTLSFLAHLHSTTHLLCPHYLFYVSSHTIFVL